MQAGRPIRAEQAKTRSWENSRSRGPRLGKSARNKFNKSKEKQRRENLLGLFLTASSCHFEESRRLDEFGGGVGTPMPARLRARASFSSVNASIFPGISDQCVDLEFLIASTVESSHFREGVTRLSAHSLRANLNSLTRSTWAPPVLNALAFSAGTLSRFDPISSRGPGSALASSAAELQFCARLLAHSGLPLRPQQRQAAHGPVRKNQASHSTVVLLCPKRWAKLTVTMFVSACGTHARKENGHHPVAVAARTLNTNVLSGFSLEKA